MRHSLEQSFKMIRDLLAALDYAHKQGIGHRDVKPANLLTEPGGRVKLSDFGVARIQDSDEATRSRSGMIGTLKYMSPEQVQGRKMDARANLFHTKDKLIKTRAGPLKNPIDETATLSRRSGTGKRAGPRARRLCRQAMSMLCTPYRPLRRSSK